MLSEEDEEIILGTEGGEYAVAFDPLDGYVCAIDLKELRV